MKNLPVSTTVRQSQANHARDAWRARLGLETGGPGWRVQGPPAPLPPAAELALLAVRELRRELAADMAALNVELGRALKTQGPIEAQRQAFRAAAAPTAFDLATRRLRHRRRIA